jgi:hypothetical protein
MIYDGEVMHLRLSPRRHGFRYRVWTMLLDIDRIDEVAAGLRLMRRNRFAPVAPGPGANRAIVDAAAAGRRVQPAVGVLLPRCCGPAGKRDL